MSLTNPKNVITEERLAEFYQGILPYLGGMPDVLANKFNKSDLYSTDEQMIGRWTDGKPIYQKVCELGEQKSIPVQSWYDTDIDCSNVDTLIDVKCLDKSKNTKVYHGSIQNSTLNIMSFRDSDKDYVTTIIMQYTKTSDSPMAIGSDTDYSTTEKIIGTWVDGKPLYQRTEIVVLNAYETGVSFDIRDAFPDMLDLIDYKVVCGYTGYNSGGLPFLKNKDKTSTDNNTKNTCSYTDGYLGGTSAKPKILTLSNTHTTQEGYFYITCQYTKAS